MSRGRLAGIVVLAAALAAAILLAPIDAGVTHIVTVVDIDRPPPAVFAYVTTAGNWPKWHPSSLAVTGTIDRPMQVGEKVIEDFRVAGRVGQVTWRVVARDAPGRWRITGDIDGRESGTVTYTLTDDAGRTHFQREFDYRVPNLFFALLDRVDLRERIQAESEQAVKQLKVRLETVSK